MSEAVVRLECSSHPSYSRNFSVDNKKGLEGWASQLKEWKDVFTLEDIATGKTIELAIALSLFVEAEKSVEA